MTTFLRRALPVIVVLLALVLSAPAGASAATSAWSLYVTSSPTDFSPEASFDTSTSGPMYVISASNVGAVPTAGDFTVSDTLPAGLRPSPNRAPTGLFGQNGAETSMTCGAVAQIVSCHGQSPRLLAGQVLEVHIPVEVEPGPPRSVVNEARIEGGGATPVSTTTLTSINAAAVPFGFLGGLPGLSSIATEADGSVATGAGSHPDQLAISLGFPTYTAATNPAEPAIRELLPSGGGVKRISTTLPSGMVANPLAVPKCTEPELESKESCPEDTQVGTVVIQSIIGPAPGEFFQPLYNMKPPTGTAGELGFEVVEGTHVHLLASINSEGLYEISADANEILAKTTIAGARVTLWGDPSDPSHDSVRGRCITATRAEGRTSCPVPRTSTAFLTMPTACSGPTVTTATAESWLVGAKAATSALSTDIDGNAVGVRGCAPLDFEPTVSTTLSTEAGDSPTGLEFDLHQPQSLEFEGRSTAALKDTEVTFPEGLVLNPSAGNNREACSSNQIGLQTAIGQSPVHFSGSQQNCPSSAKLGTVEAVTPLLDHPLPGSLYLAKPFDNPFGSLLGVYLVVEDPVTGVIAKLAGRVTPDPSTGQLTTTFEESPQLPLEDVKLRLFEGARAALTTPLVCGEHTTDSTLTPWSTPERSDGHPSASFPITGSCSSSEATASKSVSFMAGTASSLSGVYAPLVLRISRGDGTQRIEGIETNLPEGLLGKLAGVQYCPESGIAQARSRETPEMGKVEEQNPSCPKSSEVGVANVTAGSGSNPVPVSGHAYLAGPYKGAPISLVVIVPAVAGPFDLGTVVDRVALQVGEYDAQIHAVADPFPTIRDGIPLDVRSIELKLDRPGFTLNPTSCEAKAIDGSVLTQAGQTASLSNRFQVGECGRLAFKPKISISLKGGTKRTAHPALKAVVTYPNQGEYANIARAQVNLPHSEFIEQNNLNKTCTKPVLSEGKCPKSTIYGRAKAWTPLLEKPLEGNVYLVGGFGFKLPALVAELNGQIRILLAGKVDSGPNKGIRNTFEAVPDAPVEKFQLELKGGPKYSLLINSENLCKKPQRAIARFTAQNGKVLQVKPVIANDCKKKPQAGGSKEKAGGKKKAGSGGKKHRK